MATYRRVFAEENPYRRPFAEGIAHRAIVFPFEAPSHPLPGSIARALEAVVALARSAGDSGFYRFYYDVWTIGEPRLSFVPLTAVPGSYAGLDQYLEEFALFSPSGRWGVMSAEDRWAVVGTDATNLLDVFLEAFPPVPDDPRLGLQIASGWRSRAWSPTPHVSARRQVSVFLSLWEYCRARGSNVAWIPELLEHCYGQAEATRLLSESPGLG